MHVDSCTYVPGAEPCQKSLSRNRRGFVLTQEAAYNLKYVPAFLARELEVHCAQGTAGDRVWGAGGTLGAHQNHRASRAQEDQTPQAIELPL